MRNKGQVVSALVGGLVGFGLLPRAGHAVIYTTLQPEAGVDLAHLIVGQQVEIDFNFRSSSAAEVVQAFITHDVDPTRQLAYTSNTSDPSVFGSDISGGLTVYRLLYTAATPGSGSVYYDFSSTTGGYITTNVATYSQTTNALAYAITPVPEPASAGLVAVGVAGLLGRRRRA